MKTFERDGMTHVVFYDASGKRQRRSLNVPWGDALGTAAAISKLFASGPTPTAASRANTLSQVYTRALATHYAGHKDVKGVREKWKNDVCPFFGADKPIADITTGDIDDFRAWCLRGRVREEEYDDEAEPVSTKTVNRKVALLSKLLHLAVEWDQLDKLPIIRRYKERRGRIRWLTDAEEATAFAYLRAGAGGGGWAPGFRHKGDPNSPREGAADMADLCVVLIDTGLRLGEALRLCDRDVSWGAHPALHVWESKGDTQRTVPLTARAAQVLFERQKRDPVAHAKFAGSSKPFGNLTGTRCSKLWSLAREAMGLADDGEFVIHALRHTFAVRMVEGENDIKIIQQLMGHKKIETTMVYAHVSQGASRAAIAKMEARAKGVSTAEPMLRAVNGK
jgi:integrase